MGQWIQKLPVQLNHCGLLMPYGDLDLIQHWLRYWLVAWQCQTITWTNIDLTPKVFCDIHLRAISQICICHWPQTLRPSLTSKVKFYPILCLSTWLKLEPPNSHKICRTPCLRSLLFWGLIDIDLQCQIQLKSSKFHRAWVLAPNNGLNYLDCFMVPTILQSPSSAHTYL